VSVGTHSIHVKNLLTFEAFTSSNSPTSTRKSFPNGVHWHFHGERELKQNTHKTSNKPASCRRYHLKTFSTHKALNSEDSHTCTNFSWTSSFKYITKIYLICFYVGHVLLKYLWFYRSFTLIIRVCNYAVSCIFMLYLLFFIMFYWYCCNPPSLTELTSYRILQ